MFWQLGRANAFYDRGIGIASAETAGIP